HSGSTPSRHLTGQGSFTLVACVQFVPLYGWYGSLQGRTPTRTVFYAIFRLAHAVAGDLSRAPMV
ncbi:hypothetical protein KXV92_005591, partial [Aspergillus fumigatus]